MGKNLYGITDTGKLRTNNEDTFLTEEIMGGRYLAAGVIDGVGGYEGGEVAASIARESISEALNRPFDDVWGAMNGALALANRRIIAAKEGDPKMSSMACVLTLALADLSQNQFYYAHIGDTRLYLLRDHSLVKVTKDHSFVGFLEDSGRLSEEEAMRHPKRNEVNKALGFAPDLQMQSDYVETGMSPFLPGDMLLLCSDGLTDMVRSGEIISLLSGPGTLAQKGAALVDAANNAGGKDNITVVLVHNDKKRQQQAATRPKAEKKKEVKGEAPQPPAPLPSPGNRPAKGSHYLVIALAAACILLGAALLWLWTRRPSKMEAPAPAAPVRPARNSAEARLIDSIRAGALPLVLDTAVFGHTIRLTDSIQINRDSFRIVSNGVVLQADSANGTAAFFVPAGARSVTLENLVFSGFKAGIITAGPGLRLKAVRFVDCGVPVLAQHGAPADRPVSGWLRDSLFIPNDTLPKDSINNQRVWP